MVVTGTQQRVYGTLSSSSGCLIDLHRFALVSDSIVLSPPEASTVTYGDTTPYNQCGYKYSGYLTLFLSISGSTVYAAVEVRICKNDPKRIVLETYGEVAKTVTGGMALWFNKGNDAEPDWVKLNSTTSGVIMPYATTSFIFRESKRNGSTLIDCCSKCPGCRCKTCTSPELFAEVAYWHNGYTLDGLGVATTAHRTITYISDNEKLNTISVYGYPNHTYFITESRSTDWNTKITTLTFTLSAEYGAGDIPQIYLLITGPCIEYPDNYYMYPCYLEADTGNLIMRPEAYPLVVYGNTVQLTMNMPYHTTPSVYYNFGLTNHGTNTALFSNYFSEHVFVEYKWTCDTIYFWFGRFGNMPDIIGLYYNHPDSGEIKLLGVVEKNSDIIGSTSYPFDYLKNCTNLQWSKICGAYIIMHDSIGNILDANNSNCFTGKTITFSSGLCFDSVTATIIGTASPNILIIDPSTITGVYNPSYFTPDYSLTISYNSTGYSGSNTISDISTVFTIDSGNSGCLIENLPYLDRYMSSVSDYGKYTLHYDYDVSISISGSSQVEPVSLRLTIERHVAKWIPDLYVSEVHTDIDTVYSDTTHWIGSISTELYRYYGTTTDFAPTNQMRLNISVRGSSGGSSYDDVTITLNYNVTNVYLTDCKGNIVPSGQNTLPSYPYISTPFTVS